MEYFFIFSYLYKTEKKAILSLVNDKLLHSTQLWNNKKSNLFHNTLIHAQFK